MATITTKDGTQIYYKVWGEGQPVVFSHGWPLSADAFEDQMIFLAARGYRCIAHDRRGHGRSSQPCPRRSWAMQRYPRAARKIIWSSKASALSGQPWLKTTGWPSPQTL